MNRWTPLSRPTRWVLLRRGQEPRPGGPALISFRPISLVTRLLVWIVRGTPLILQIIALFYVPGLILEDGSPWPRGEVGRMAAVCVAFIINYAFYFSEIYRGGIQGVPAGQNEAGLVLGMTKRQIFFKVTLLQMVKRIVPPHVQRDHHPGQGHLSGPGHCDLQEVIWAAESFMKGQSGDLRPVVAADVHGGLLPGLQRHRDHGAGPAGKEAGLLPGIRGANMPILEVHHIEKHFGATRVLEDISFDLEQGQALAIIGSSGSGKTTLLRCLNFLETPDQGQIVVQGDTLFDADDPATQRESEVRKKRLHFGLVFQSFNLFPQYTALKNVTLAKELSARNGLTSKPTGSRSWRRSRPRAGSCWPRWV